MANFLTDNPDILFHIEHTDLARIADVMEDERNTSSGRYGFNDSLDEPVVEGYREGSEMIMWILGGRVLEVEDLETPEPDTIFTEFSE